MLGDATHAARSASVEVYAPLPHLLVAQESLQLRGTRLMGGGGQSARAYANR